MLNDKGFVVLLDIHEEGRTVVENAAMVDYLVSRGQLKRLLTEEGQDKSFVWASFTTLGRRIFIAERRERSLWRRFLRSFFAPIW